METEEKESSSPHQIKLTIKNDTKYPLTNPQTWFDSGGVDKGFYFSDVNPGKELVILMSRGILPTGCSGYVTYSFNGGFLTIAFSNPKVGSNKLGCGNSGKEVWHKMSSHDYKSFVQEFVINGVTVVANESCTGGSLNQAVVQLTTR